MQPGDAGPGGASLDWEREVRGFICDFLQVRGIRPKQVLLWREASRLEVTCTLLRKQLKVASSCLREAGELLRRELGGKLDLTEVVCFTEEA